MMLVVEGPDGVGKTTLCRELVRRLPGWVYAHFTRLQPEFDRYWGYVERMSRRVVQDRFHMSEVAYARARGEEPAFGPEVYRLLDARLRLLGGYTVLVTATEELVASRWDQSQMYDLGRTLAAARNFALIRDRREEVGADVDFSFECDAGRPYVTRDAVDQILEEYLARQRAVDEVACRRPHEA